LTTQQTPAQPSSSNDQRRSIWTGRNVLIGSAILTGLPLIVGALGFRNLSYWPGVASAAAAEAAAVAAAVMFASIVPRFRQALEIPDINGDERERMIAMKASNISYLFATTLLMVGALALVGTSVTVRPLWLIWACLAIQVSNYSSMIYYNRKM
jgi:hypothetical protein